MIPFDSGTPPPIFDNFHQTDSVGSRSEIDLLINRVRKVEKQIQSRTLWKDLLPHNAICAFFFAFRHRNRKVDGGHWCVQKPEKPEFSTFRIWPGHPPTPRNFCRALSDRRWREESWEVESWELRLETWDLILTESARNSDLEGDPSRYGEKFPWGEPYSIV